MNRTLTVDWSKLKYSGTCEIVRQICKGKQTDKGTRWLTDEEDCLIKHIRMISLQHLNLGNK